MKLTRKQIQQGLEQTPFVDIVGVNANSQLTKKQRDFAMNVAKGDTGAEAYRKAYKTKGKPATQSNEALKLRKRPEIATTIERLSMALEGQKYQTPAALRALVIQSLVNVIIDEEANHSQVIAAAKVLGTVTEVAAFTEQKQITTITSSEDARAKVMQQLKQLMRSEATDVDAVEIEALSLEKELRGPRETPTTPNGELESHPHIHTIPLKQPQSESIPLEQSPENLTPHPFDDSAPPSVDADLETPPGDVSDTKGV